MKKYVATVRFPNHDSELAGVVGVCDTKEEALGQVMLFMQNNLLFLCGEDSDVRFSAIKTCGFDDNGEDTVFIEATAHNATKYEERVGYVYRIEVEASE